MNIIKIYPDYECSPILAMNKEGFFEPIEIDEINEIVSMKLIEQINNWRIKFDMTLNMIDARESGFKNTFEEAAFENEGIEIWKDLIIQLPKYKIFYFSIIDNFLYESIHEYFNLHP